MRNLRAPTTMAPAVGWHTGSPISGARSGTVPISCDQRFELASANVFEVDALRPPRGGFVEVDRHLQLAPDLAAHALGQPHAFLQRDAFDGNERHHVGRADARVRALVLASGRSAPRPSPPRATPPPPPPRAGRRRSARSGCDRRPLRDRAAPLRAPRGSPARWRRSWPHRALRRNSERTLRVVGTFRFLGCLRKQAGATAASESSRRAPWRSARLPRSRRRRGA